MLWALGFLVTFLFGGLTGVILASPALDFQLSDSYFVVAHFHYVVFGTVVFAMFAGYYFWWPKFTGRMLDERLGKIHFWMLFIGFHTTFLIQHRLGIAGHAPALRRLPARGRLHARQPDLDARRRSSSRSSMIPFLYERLEDVAHRAARRDRRPVGLRRRRSSGPPPARRRGTTSTASRGSAPSAPRSTCTTPRRCRPG